MPIPKSKYVSDVWKEGCMTGQVVFCTGGAGTICSAQVRALVHLGANACIIGRNEPKTIAMAADIATARSGSKVLGIGNVDVRKPDSLKAAVASCTEQMGGPTIVIAGAAGNFLVPMTQLSENAFKSVMDIDVLGSFNLIRAALPHLMAAAKRSKDTNGLPPRILFVSATLHYQGTPLQTHVAAAKAAIDALSSQCAIELGPRGITSNVIAPGAIAETEGVARLMDPDRGGDYWYGPMGKMGTIKDVADATVWLCSDAGAYINGTVVIVDGGAWRTSGIGGEGRFKYPHFLLSDDEVTGVAGGKKSKL